MALTKDAPQHRDKRQKTEHVRDMGQELPSLTISVQSHHPWSQFYKTVGAWARILDARHLEPDNALYDLDMSNFNPIWAESASITLQVAGEVSWPTPTFAELIAFDFLGFHSGRCPNHSETGSAEEVAGGRLSACVDPG